MPPILRQVIVTSILGLAVTSMAQPATLFAQTTGSNDTSTVAGRTGSMGTSDDTRTVDRRTNDGFNPGWLGLAGLAGLLGLMPKKTHPVVATTHRTGDNLTR